MLFSWSFHTCNAEEIYKAIKSRNTLCLDIFFIFWQLSSSIQLIFQVRSLNFFLFYFFSEQMLITLNYKSVFFCSSILFNQLITIQIQFTVSEFSENRVWINLISYRHKGYPLNQLHVRAHKLHCCQYSLLFVSGKLKSPVVAHFLIVPTSLRMPQWSTWCFKVYGITAVKHDLTGSSLPRVTVTKTNIEVCHMGHFWLRISFANGKAFREYPLCSCLEK